MIHPLSISLTILIGCGATAAQDRGPQRSPSPDTLLAALDTDGDGELSAAEIAAASASLAKLDADGDGRISKAEFAPDAAAAPRRAEEAAAAEPSRAADDDAERTALAVLADLDENRRGNMSVPEEDGRFLRVLAESMNAQNVVEIGTSNGYSGIWLCLALRATGGRLVTHEIDPQRAERARANFERAGVDELVTIVEGDAHETVERLDEPIDLLFLDADKSGYLDYLQKLLPKVRDGGLIVAHNMNRPEPDPAFLEAIKTDPRLETLFFHMDAAGIAVSLKKGAR